MDDGVFCRFDHDLRARNLTRREIQSLREAGMLRDSYSNSRQHC